MTKAKHLPRHGPYFERGELVVTPRGLLARVVGYGFDGRVELEYVSEPSQKVSLYADLLELKETNG